MNRLSVGLLVLFCLAPGVAEAQLPLPNLGEAGPDVRLARDEFVDRAQSFKTRIEKLQQKQKQANDAERSRVEKLRKQYELSQDPESGVVPPADFDPADASRIFETLEREDELLAQSVELAGRAVLLAEREASSPATTNFDEVVDLKLKARRLEGEAEAADGVVERLKSLLDVSEQRTGATIAERLIEHEWRLQSVQVEHARAVSFELRAKARVSREEAEAARKALKVTTLDAARAEAERSVVAADVQDELAELDKEKKKVGSEPVPQTLDPDTAKKVREAYRALTLSRLDLIGRKRASQQARLLRAEARAVGVEALSKGVQAEWPRNVSPQRVLAHLAALDQDRTSLDALIGRLRQREEKLASDSPVRKALEKRRSVIEDDLRIVRETRLHFEVVQVMHSVSLEPGVASRTGMPIEVAVVLSLLVILCGGLLLVYGLRYMHALIQSDKLQLKQKLAGQLDTAVSLIWPLLVFAICSSILVWPIWQLDITLFEALKVIDTPLFYVDETGVSVFSVVELLFAIWAAVVLSRAIREFLTKRVYKNLGWDIGLTNALNTLVHYVVLLIGIVIGVRFVGIGASSFAILAGILGIGIGFGLRNITENFISGLIILAERPIKIGDYINIDGEVEGRIESISARSTTVVTRDNITLIIPNSEFVGQRVTNWSHGDPKVRVAVPVGVAYGSDTDLVRKTLLEVAGRHNQILKKPKPEVHFRSFGNSSLDFLLLVWLDEQQHRFRIASDLHFAIDKAFRKVAIEIAFPQMDLHLKSVTEQSAQALNTPYAPPIEEPDPTASIDIPDGRPKATSKEPQMSLPDGRSRGSGAHKPP